MENKLIYGREQLNEELINKRNHFEESKNVLEKLLEEKVEISKKNEQMRKEIDINNKIYKNYKKQELKRLIVNLLQVIGIFGGVGLLCNIPLISNPYIINVIISVLGGFGCTALISEYIYNITNYKKECNRSNNERIKFLNENDNVCYEISKINNDLTDINEKISRLDKTINRNVSKEEIDYKELKTNKYINFYNEMSKPKQKCLKK